MFSLVLLLLTLLIPTFDSGSAFVDPADSYLRFKLQVQNNAGAGVGGFCLGSGSATNVLQRITIFSKTGKELSRVEDANVLNCFMNRYKHENDWVNTLGANEGLSVHRGPTAYADEIPAGGKVFCIPLKTIFPCFCNYLPLLLSYQWFFNAS
jgi:hypothetical protein